jgi:hypothetical protein
MNNKLNKYKEKKMKQDLVSMEMIVKKYPITLIIKFSSSIEFEIGEKVFKSNLTMTYLSIFVDSGGSPCHFISQKYSF